MELEDGKLYKIRHLFEYLIKRGLPASRPTIIKYERAGIIPSPRMVIEGSKIQPRVYTAEQIRAIGDILEHSVESGVS